MTANLFQCGDKLVFNCLNAYVEKICNILIRHICEFRQPYDTLLHGRKRRNSLFHSHDKLFIFHHTVVFTAKCVAIIEIIFEMGRIDIAAEGTYKLVVGYTEKIVADGFGSVDVFTCEPKLDEYFLHNILRVFPRFGETKAIAVDAPIIEIV